MLLWTIRSTRALENAGSSDGGSAPRLIVIVASLCSLLAAGAAAVPWRLPAAGAAVVPCWLPAAGAPGAPPPQADSTSETNSTTADHRRVCRVLDMIAFSFPGRIGGEPPIHRCLPSGAETQSVYGAQRAPRPLGC